MWPSAMGYSSIQMPEEQRGRGFVVRSAKFLNRDPRFNNFSMQEFVILMQGYISCLKFCICANCIMDL